MSTRKYYIVIFVLFTILFTVAFGLYFYLRKKPEDTQKETSQIAKTEEVPDLYQGDRIGIVEPRLVRGLYKKFEAGKFVLQDASTGSDQQILEIVPSEKTTYDCLSRYMNVGGRQIDRVGMFLDTRDFNENDIPEGKSLEWFLKTVELGEAVEVRKVEGDDGTLIPAIIYVYKNTCPAD